MPRSVLTGAKQHKGFQEFLQGYQLPATQLEKVRCRYELGLREATHYDVLCTGTHSVSAQEFDW